MTDPETSLLDAYAAGLPLYLHVTGFPDTARRIVTMRRERHYFVVTDGSEDDPWSQKKEAFLDGPVRGTGPWMLRNHTIVAR